MRSDRAKQFYGQRSHRQVVWRVRESLPVYLEFLLQAFALFWIASASGMFSSAHGATSAAPFPFALFPLFGIPFVLAGLGLLTSPLWLMRKASRTAYAITNKRVLILDGAAFRATTIRSLGPEMLGDRTRTQSNDGSGDLIFTRASTISLQSGYNSNLNSSFSSYNRGGTIVNQVGFYGIPNVKSVDDLLRDTFEGKRTTSP